MADDKILAVQPGDWNVKGDLIVPDSLDLFIAPGRALRFEPNAILYSSGSLTIAGSDEEPVLLTAQESYLVRDCCYSGGRELNFGVHDDRENIRHQPRWLDL